MCCVFYFRKLPDRPAGRGQLAKVRRTWGQQWQMMDL